MTLETFVGHHHMKSKKQLFSSLHEIKYKYDDEDNVSRSVIKKWHSYPVSALP